MSTSLLTTTTIFWPLGLTQKSGYCYGWKEPAHCVAGVLEAETVGGQQYVTPYPNVLTGGGSHSCFRVCVYCTRMAHTTRLVWWKARNFCILRI